jgi:transcription-repair coupling factor (superfamily II helicase)
LAAIREFSDLGAGFRIAALDLELRGAGNMLGGEQSGHIEAIGFEMYTSMLEEAVRRIKGEDDKPAHADTSVNLGISVRIDADYIPEENQRLRMYKKIAGSQTLPELEEVRAEMKDRYGEPPESVENLLAAGEIRLMAQQLGIALIDRKRTQIELNKTKTFIEMLNIKFAEREGEAAALNAIDPGTLMKMVSRNTKRGAQFTPQGVLRWPLTSAKAEDVLKETRALLESLDAKSAMVS